MNLLPLMTSRIAADGSDLFLSSVVNAARLFVQTPSVAFIPLRFFRMGSIPQYPDFINSARTHDAR